MTIAGSIEWSGDRKTVACSATEPGVWLFADGAVSLAQGAVHTHAEAGEFDPKFVALADLSNG